MIKHLVALALVLSVSSALAASDFKGEPPSTQLTWGGMAGLAQIHSEAGLAVIGSVAKKLFDKGFVPDINNQVFIELQGGPLFVNDVTLFGYSAHLRWDFVKDSRWTLYGLGGLGGNVGKFAPGAQSEFVLHPRFGAGAFLQVAPFIALRGELSAEWTTVGVSISL